MIDENLAREAIGSLGTAAAMLIEDAHAVLVMRLTDAGIGGRPRDAHEALGRRS